VRAGNVIGGGDWAEDRIVPDCMRALLASEPIPVRNPHAVRPWQHVLEPLSGYVALAAELYRNSALRGSWNFGPTRDSHRTVGELVDALIELWGSGSKLVAPQPDRPVKETSLLYLNCDKATRELGWSPSLTFRESLSETVDWYRLSSRGADVWELTKSQIDAYVSCSTGLQTCVAPQARSERRGIVSNTGQETCATVAHD
jgi:CDP-glucose 4,6-dehydratase